MTHSEKLNKQFEEKEIIITSILKLIENRTYSEVKYILKRIKNHSKCNCILNSSQKET
ncbi:hypothetical protein J2T04_003585 [Chryseobacterium lathyri]|uniref:Uncharacterized protein n=1 Tax=Chryseobacterium lathyri TaxID=395933 RepID=A0ABT9SQF6_9FLAO|nr:hypothetical protein [Chryseobacterium lathyri]